MTTKDPEYPAAKTLSSLFTTIMPTKHEEDLVTTSRGMMRLLVAPLVSQMGITANASKPVSLFDNACGSGVLTQEVRATLPKDVLSQSTFFCADSSEAMVNLVKKRVEAEGWAHTGVKTLNAMDTRLPDNSFTHVGIGLGLHIIPEPDKVLADCKRILVPGGVLGATTFHRDNKFWIPDTRSAFASLPFTAPLPETLRMQMHDSGDWTDPAWIEQHMKEQGFVGVKVTVVPGSCRMESANEFLRTFGMMITWLTNSWWTEEQRREHPIEEVRELTKKHLEEKYGGEGWEINWVEICATGRVDK